MTEGLDLEPHGEPGVLITCSGGDGTGKSTLAAVVSAYVRECGVACEERRSLSEACRRLPYFQRYSRDPEKALAEGFDLAALGVVCLGDRLFQLRNEVMPLLASGVWVVEDRYVYTTLAELSLATCSNADRAIITALARRFPRPDLPLLADASVGTVLRRLRDRPEERDHRHRRSYVAALLEAFRAVAEANRLLVVDTEADPATTFKAIQPHVDALLDRSLYRIR